MKLGLLSDIHGNLPALEAAITELGRRRVNTVAFAGDAVGTLGWSDETVSFLRVMSDYNVYGNHDANVMRRFQGSNEVLSMEYNIVRDQLSDENYQWLSDLDDKLYIGISDENRKLVLVHAHPQEEPYHGFPADNYLDQRHYTKAGSQMDYDVLIHGHTHDQAALRLDKFDGLSGLIINPGSVGVPWYEPADFAVLDTETLEYDLLSAEYDTDRNKEKFMQMGLDGWRDNAPDRKL